MAVNDNFEVKISATFQGDVAMNVLHYQQTAGAGGITAVIGSLIDGILADFVPKMQACMTSYVQFQSIRVQQVGVVAPLIEKRGTVLEGLVSDVNPLPGQDAVLFVKRCNSGGRANVGKFYLVGVNEAIVDGGLVNVGTDYLEDMAVQIKTNIVSGGNTFAPIIWHRAAQTAEFITRCEVRPQISRQNRRHLPVY